MAYPRDLEDLANTILGLSFLDTEKFAETFYTLTNDDDPDLTQRLSLARDFHIWAEMHLEEVAESNAQEDKE